jgi:hypothetical protein
MGLGEPIGVVKDVEPIHLVVELVEAELGLSLRFDVELPLETPYGFRSYQAHANLLTLVFIGKRSQK